MKTNLLTGLTFIVLTFASIANEKHAKQQTVQQAEKQNTSAQQLLDVVRKDLVSMQADFVQYEIDANDNVSEKIGGEVWLQTPNKFKWEYKEPSPQLILANGKLVWIYDEDLEQVTIKKQQNSKNPIYILLNKQDTEKNFDLNLLEKVKGNEQTVDWIEMTPKSPGDDVKKVWLGIENNNLKVIKLKNQMDNIVIFEFSKVKKNPELAKGFFTFVVPKGIDVIRDAGFSAEF